MISLTFIWLATVVTFVNCWADVNNSEEETQTNITNCYVCSPERADTILRCTSIIVDDDTEMLNFDCISERQKQFLTRIIVENSTIPTLNLNFIKQNKLTGLSEISFYNCDITNVIGNIPCNISSLELSNSSIRNFAAVLDATVEDVTEEDEDSFETIDIDDDGHFTTIRPVLTNCTSGVFSLAVNNNFLEELPAEIVASTRLKELYLSGNPLKCEFIWETVWDHLSCQSRPLDCKNIFVDQNVTTCQFYRQKLVPSNIFHYNLTEIFDSKIILENECSDMNKTCECHPFNLLRDKTGRYTVYLTLNCAGRNLTELPRISSYTWELNVSSNYIQDLSRLNSSMYKNLRRLDIQDNQVDTLVDLTNTIFMKQFDLLYINSNKFQEIPDNFLIKVKNSEGKATLKIGSELDCNCVTATHTKGGLIELQANILDINDVLCWNIKQQLTETSNFDGNETDENLLAKTELHSIRLTDLKITDVCSLNDFENDDWVFWIIAIEIICIVGVTLKVSYDWREYRRTGMLPWISQKLPRLPCDGILE